MKTTDVDMEETIIIKNHRMKRLLCGRLVVAVGVVGAVGHFLIL